MSRERLPTRLLAGLLAAAVGALLALGAAACGEDRGDVTVEGGGTTGGGTGATALTATEGGERTAPTATEGRERTAPTATEGEPATGTNAR